jgi:hypothetical protein
VLVKNGTVIDGTGAAARHAEVAGSGARSIGLVIGGKRHAFHALESSRMTHSGPDGGTYAALPASPFVRA